MSGRHVRLYYFDAYGQEIPKAICSAVMPMYRMPITNRPAREYAGPSHQPRRELAAVVVLAERSRQSPRFVGMLVIACPAREGSVRRRKTRMAGVKPYLVPTSAFLASFAALSPMGQVVAGDVMAETLGCAYREGLTLLRDVLVRKPGEVPARGAFR